MESRKMVQMNYFQGNNGDTDIENRLTDSGCGGGEGESNMATHITICKIHSQWEFAV